MLAVISLGTYDKPGNPCIILSLNFQTTQAGGHYFSYFRNVDTQVQKQQAAFQVSLK